MNWFLAVTFAGSVLSLILFVIALMKGQFDNLEDVKYQMFHEDD